MTPQPLAACLDADPGGGPLVRLERYCCWYVSCDANSLTGSLPPRFSFCSSALEINKKHSISKINATPHGKLHNVLELTLSDLVVQLHRAGTSTVLVVRAVFLCLYKFLSVCNNHIKKWFGTKCNKWRSVIRTRIIFLLTASLLARLFEETTAEIQASKCQPTVEPFVTAMICNVKSVSEWPSATPYVCFPGVLFNANVLRRRINLCPVS